MKIKGTVVKVDGPDHGVDVIADEGFLMDEAWGILKDFDPRLNKLAIIAPSQMEDGPLIWDMRGKNPHINSRKGRSSKGVFHLGIDNKVWGRDIDITLGPRNYGKVDVLANGCIVKRHIAIGLNEAIAMGESANVIDETARRIIEYVNGRRLIEIALP